MMTFATMYEFIKEYDTESVLNFGLVMNELGTLREKITLPEDGIFMIHKDLDPLDTKNCLQIEYIENLSDDLEFYTQFNTEFVIWEKIDGSDRIKCSPFSFSKVFLNYVVYEEPEEEEEEEEDQEEEIEVDDDISDLYQCVGCCDVDADEMSDVLEYAKKLPEGLYLHYANVLHKLYKSEPKIVISKRRYLSFLTNEIHLSIKLEKKKKSKKKKGSTTS